MGYFFSPILLFNLQLLLKEVLNMNRIESAVAHCQEISKLSDEELQNEYDFYIAEKILNSMLEAGLISDDELNKLRTENKRIFSPLLAEIT